MHSTKAKIKLKSPKESKTQTENSIVSFFKKILNLEDPSDKPELIFPSSSPSPLSLSLKDPPHSNLLQQNSSFPNSTPFTSQEWQEHFSNRLPSQLNQNRLLIFLKTGIPPSLRAKIWIYLSGSFESYKQNKQQSTYQELLLSTNPTAEEQINKDLHRTFLNESRNKLIKLENTNKLFNVLKAYAVYDKEVGYCQGTNTIVATLLHCINKEELCFWTFCNLMQKNCWRDFFIANTPKLFRMINILQTNIKQQLRDLYAYFQKVNLDEYLGIMITHYFLTLFTYECPLELSLRIIDLFWVYEEKVIFDIVVVLLKSKQEKLMTMDKEDIMVYLKKNLVFDVIKEKGIDFIMNSI